MARSVLKYFLIILVILFSLEIISRLFFYFVPKALISMNLPLPNIIQTMTHVMVKNVVELRNLDEQIGSTIPHKELAYVFKPNHKFYIRNPYGQDILYETKDLFGDGEFGLRDDGIDKELFALAVGDSFTFCMHLDMKDCWVEIVENERNLDVINTGVYGWGTYQELLMLKKVFQKLGDRKQSIKYIFWQITFTDYQDDLCFLEGKMCNIFSPLFIYTPANSALGLINYSFLAGFILTLYDVVKFRFTFDEQPREPDAKVFNEAEDICQDIGCKLIIIYSYRSIVKPRLCSKYRCIYPKYTEDMFIPNDRHHNPKGSRFLAQQILDFVHNEERKQN